MIDCSQSVFSVLIWSLVVWSKKVLNMTDLKWHLAVFESLELNFKPTPNIWFKFQVFAIEMLLSQCVTAFITFGEEHYLRKPISISSKSFRRFSHHEWLCLYNGRNGLKCFYLKSRPRSNNLTHDLRWKFRTSINFLIRGFVTNICSATKLFTQNKKNWNKSPLVFG